MNELENVLNQLVSSVTKLVQCTDFISLCTLTLKDYTTAQIEAFIEGLNFYNISILSESDLTDKDLSRLQHYSYFRDRCSSANQDSERYILGCEALKQGYCKDKVIRTKLTTIQLLLIKTAKYVI